MVSAMAAGAGGGDVEVGAAEVRVLRELVHLFALSVMEQDMADFRARDYMSAEQADMAAQEVMRLCRCVATRGWELGWELA